MIVTVYDENMQSIEAVLTSYNSAEQELEREIIPVGGSEYYRPGTATHWVFAAPGYRTVSRSDLMNYDTSFSQQLIRKNRWVVPVLVGVFAYALVTRKIKF